MMRQSKCKVYEWHSCGERGGAPNITCGNSSEPRDCFKPIFFQLLEAAAGNPGGKRAKDIIA
jgi:hypothetical protein